MRKKIIITVIGLVFAGFILMRILQTSGPQKIAELSGLSRVKVGYVQSATVKEEYKFVAVVKGKSQSVVYPQVPGIIREKIREAGEYVKRDGNILLIDRNEAALKYSMSAVESPIDGKVLQILVDIGTRVDPQTPVAVVGDMTSVKAVIGVDSEDIALIKKGLRARIVSPEGKNVYGRISAVADSAGKRSRKFSAEITARNNADLKSGVACDIFVTVREIKTNKAVPGPAITERSGDNGIFKISKDDTAGWVKVKIIAKGKDLVAVEGDISSGDRIVTEGSYGLIPGRKVEILQ
jgi:multidrug efflux pump subunit AcrA (membrane-fusion protein)